jgi:hypothetical protein
MPFGPSRRRSSRPRTSPSHAVLFTLALVALAGCESSREAVPRNPVERHLVRQRGRAIVERAAAAHGGWETWRAKHDVSFRFVDQWSNAAGRMVRPWPVQVARGELQSLIGTGYGRVTIGGKDGEVTYALGPAGPWALRGTRPSQDATDFATARSTIPAYLFLFEMPFSFLAQDAVQHYMGVRPAPPGGPVHEVLVTYPWYVGDRSRDWYVARFDTATMRLRSVTYTASTWGPSMFEYTDDLGGYKQVDSLWIPTEHKVRMSWPFRPDLHAWSVSDIRFNQGLDTLRFEGPAPLGGAVADTSARAKPDSARGMPDRGRAPR